MPLLTAATALLLGISPGAKVSPQPHPKVYVYGESDTEGMRYCGISHAAAIAAAESELKRRGLELGDREAFLGGKAIPMYVSLNIDRANEVPTPHCFGSIRLAMQAFGYMVSPATGLRHRVVMSFCDQGSDLYLRRSSSPGELIKKVEQHVGACLSAYAETIK